MTRHPLLLAVFTTDLLAFLLLAGAAATAFRIALHWNPADTSEKQLRLQARSETAAMAVAWATGLAICATAVLVYALTNILPGLVPGAMCGTGVLQAMESAGPRMLIYRLVALAVLWTGWRVQKVNQFLPEAPLVALHARLVLLALPVLGLALHAAWQATLAMDLQQPVDCCAVIYDQFRTASGARRTMGLGYAAWLTAFGIASIAAAGAALTAWKTPFHRRRHQLLAVLATGWLPIAAITLVRVLAAYHYGVLHHHCPWCLFLPVHHLAGFPVWTAWLLVALETPAALVLSSLSGQPAPGTAVAAGHQAAIAARNTLLAILSFGVLSGGPALLWRLRFGMWLAG
jgi:hypothetical protein